MNRINHGIPTFENDNTDEMRYLKSHYELLNGVGAAYSNHVSDFSKLVSRVAQLSFGNR